MKEANVVKQSTESVQESFNKALRISLDQVNILRSDLSTLRDITQSILVDSTVLGLVQGNAGDMWQYVPASSGGIGVFPMERNNPDFSEKEKSSESALNAHTWSNLDRVSAYNGAVSSIQSICLRAMDDNAITFIQGDVAASLLSSAATLHYAYVSRVSEIIIEQSAVTADKEDDVEIPEHMVGLNNALICWARLASSEQAFTQPSAANMAARRIVAPAIDSIENLLLDLLGRITDSSTASSIWTELMESLDAVEDVRRVPVFSADINWIQSRVARLIEFAAMYRNVLQTLVRSSRSYEDESSKKVAASR